MAKTKIEKLQAMERIEQELRETADKYQLGSTLRAVHESAAGHLHVVRMCLRLRDVDDREAALAIDDSLLELVKTLGRIALNDSKAAAVAGLIPMRIATECCSET